MLKRVFKLFQIARKLSTSGAIDTINQSSSNTVSINLFFSLISIGSKNTHLDKIINQVKISVKRFKVWALHL